jgi:sugar phosphate isomerase/epimerase
MIDLKRRVQVNVPFTMLWDTYLSHCTQNLLNPEIGIDAEALDRFSLEDFRSVAETLQRHALTVTFHAPFVGLCPGSTDPAVRAVARRRFEEMLRLVPIFKPVTVVAHSGYDWRRHEYFREAWVANSIEFWSWTAEALGREGAHLMLENVYEERPAEMQVLFERLRPLKVGLCLDCGHLTAFGRAPLSEWLESLGGFIGQIHLHDNLGQKDDHLALGKGRIDFSQLFAFLKARHPAPPVLTLEIHQPEDLEPSLGHLAELWPW